MNPKNPNIKSKSKSPKSIRNRYLETINERTSKENINEKYIGHSSKNIFDVKNSMNLSKYEEKILHSVSFDKLNNFSKDHSDISYLEEGSRRLQGNKKLNPLDRVSNTLTISNNSTNRSHITKRKKAQKDLILPLVRKETNIDPTFLQNESKIVINEKKILGLSDSNFVINLDAVIYDLEVFKMTIFNGDNRYAQKYCQITKKEFKYFSSIYSSTVWQDRPLLRLPIIDIEKARLKYNQHHKIKGLVIGSTMTDLQIYIPHLPSAEDKHDLILVKNKKNGKMYKLFSFSIVDEESAQSLYKIINYLSSIFKDY